VEGTRHTVVGADGVSIGLLTAGSGPPLVLVHGGFGQIEAWAPMWDQLIDRWRVTAMDRRGRGTSGGGDDVPYALEKEYGDVAAVVGSAAEDSGHRVDVFGHSFGATCALGAVAAGAPIHRLALYEPPGPETVSPEWVERASAMVESGQVGRALVSFLSEILALTDAQVEALKSAPLTYDIMAVVAATLAREAQALTTVDLLSLMRSVLGDVLLLLGTASPPWAAAITGALAEGGPATVVVRLDGIGHDGIDTAPEQLVEELARFFGP
jgi:pimeloyl-ACP methyl ester carboxylesterase